MSIKLGLCYSCSNRKTVVVGKFRLLKNDVVLQPSIVKSRGWSRSTVLLKETNLTTMNCSSYPGENVGENTRIICENYALFSRAISSDRAHFSPFRRLFSRISRARAVTRAIR